ncbi:putative UDP-glucuronosyltransferase ugt-50 [Oppia nitens]|uniref:putative UDP-glucuronosyltransferase ugt-50 n=1 Tax=Oppia nitens TaxID=1686743 RepID=UPI0023D98AB4|nr:putative UDP-glucuronosyltransferase ugt-50 [Oppia nitens]
MVKQYHAVICSFPGVGHVNACLAVAERLVKSGHFEVSFVVNEKWKGRLEPYGVREVLLKGSDHNHQHQHSHNDGHNGNDGHHHHHNSHQTDDHKENHVVVAVENDDHNKTSDEDVLVKQTKKKSPLDKILENYKRSHNHLDMIVEIDKQLGEVLAKLKPDIIFQEVPTCIPSVVNYGVPWVNVLSMNPLFYLEDDRTPPLGSGLSKFDDKIEWKKFREALSDVKRNAFKEFHKYLADNGVTDFESDKMTYQSKYLNIYGYPEELDYHELRPLPKTWYRFDNMMRLEKHVEAFEIPDKLKGKPGKLIFFSFGSMSCQESACNVENMNRLLAILAKSPNRFIVSMGPKHEDIRLADNMWGQPSIPQIQVLPLCDLAIIHGGNNTMTETVYFGKPMILLPQEGDQLDNAQRVQDMGFGVRLDRNDCTENELLSTIDKLLADKQLANKMKQISKRIQLDDNYVYLF